jgi:tyrosyl-tRNA synthetase
VHVPKILTEQGITTSNSEARRLITAGSFKIDGEKYTDLDVDFSEISGKTLQLGKRNFFIFN